MNRLWETYRLATSEPEASVNFMPEMWAKIDAARPASWAFPVIRLASRFLPLAAALALALGVYTWSPRSGSTGAGYVDMLATDLLADLGEDDLT
ncbi:MAG: hypothetical protein HY238_28345 [Acidobacteria bacterium]|nr:hypothetical protein [Acidobacteriota bacterium]